MSANAVEKPSKACLLMYSLLTCHRYGSPNSHSHSQASTNGNGPTPDRDCRPDSHSDGTSHGPAHDRTSANPHPRAIPYRDCYGYAHLLTAPYFHGVTHAWAAHARADNHSYGTAHRAASYPDDTAYSCANSTAHSAASYADAAPNSAANLNDATTATAHGHRSTNAHLSTTSHVYTGINFNAAAPYAYAATYPYVATHACGNAATHRAASWSNINAN